MNYTIENSNNLLQIDGQPQNGILGANQGPRHEKHTIENNKNSLRNLLLKVQDQHDRAADYLAPTHDLQKITDENGRPQVVMEKRGGEPTRIFDINDVAFGQIASHA